MRYIAILVTLLLPVAPLFSQGSFEDKILDKILSSDTFSPAPPEGNPSLAFAESLYATEEYDEAKGEYKRAIFLSEDKSVIRFATYKLSVCLLREKNFEDALHILSSFDYDQDDTISITAHLLSVLLFALLGKKESVHFELANLTSRGEPEILPKILYVKGWAELILGDIEGAKRSFETVVNTENDIPERDRSYSLLREIKGFRPLYVSPEEARWLSVAIPGAGQMYAGEIKEGINSLALNLLLGGATVSYLFKGGYIQAATIATFLWSRYWWGSNINAARLAEEKNKRINREFVLKLVREYGI